MICLVGKRDLLRGDEGRVCGGESDLRVGSDLLMVGGGCGSFEARPELDAAVVFPLSRTVAGVQLMIGVCGDFVGGGGLVVVLCSDAGCLSCVVVFGGAG